jgi:hypothetical protein
MHGVADGTHAVGMGGRVADLKFASAREASIEVCFEPVGTTFSLSDGDCVFLRSPLEAVASIEVVVWPNGIGVWVPYPGDYVILNRDKIEIDRL